MAEATTKAPEATTGKTKDPLTLFREHAVFPEFPVQKYLLDERLSKARQLATEHFLSIQTDAHVPFQRFQEFLNAEELTVRDNNKQALNEVVLSKLQTLTLPVSRPEHVTDEAFHMFQGQYMDAKTWFCDMYPGFEVYWSEAVLHYVQNWVSEGGVHVHLSKATECYLAAIGAREVPILLKALNEQRSELIVQEHVRKRLAYWNQTLSHSIVKLSTLVHTHSRESSDREQVKEAYQLIQKLLDEFSQ